MTGRQQPSVRREGEKEQAGEVLRSLKKKIQKGEGKRKGHFIASREEN